MPINVDDVIQLYCHLAKVKGMKAAVRHSGWRAVLTVSSAVIGGLMGGPPGIAVGGAVGGLLGAWMTSGQFKPVPQILMELPPAKKQKLYKEAIAHLKYLEWADISQLIPLVMGDISLQQKLTTVLKNYILQELSAKIKFGE